MSIAAIVVALLLIFVAARFVLAFLDGKSVPTRSPERPVGAGTISLDASDRAKLQAVARAQLLLDAEIERRRHDEARRAAIRAAAIVRRSQKDIPSVVGCA